MIKLSLAKFRPYFRLVRFDSKLFGTLNVLLLDKKNFNGVNRQTKLLVDAKGLVVEFVIIFLGNPGKFRSIIVVKSVDIVHYFGLISFNCGQDKQVLKVVIVCKT